MMIHRHTTRSLFRMICLLVCFMATSQLFGQGGFRMGGKAGAAFTHFVNEDWQNDNQVSFTPSIAGFGGVSFGYNATYYNMGFTLGFFFKQYTMQLQQSTPNPSWTRKLKAQYMEIPVLFRLRPAGDRNARSFTYGGGYFEVGLQPGFLLAATDTYTDTIPELNYNNADVKNAYENFNLGAVLGFGFHQVGTEHWAVTHGLRFSYAFLDAIREKKLIGPQANGSVNLFSAGYIFVISYKF